VIFLLKDSVYCHFELSITRVMVEHPQLILSGRVCRVHFGVSPDHLFVTPHSQFAPQKVEGQVVGLIGYRQESTTSMSLGLH
jgi:hypothetical protein